MIIEGDTVTFKSTPLIYERERDGEKPNITRIIKVEEWDELTDNYPHRIRIFSTINNTKHWFERKITSITWLWQMFNYKVITISWQHVTEEAQDEKS